ncbi:hypothetical protein CVT26_013436 [Gymnopilus dilepis]|uniref:Uncharacterized protein n=1 Tax=Gymnopilus dilepis TaxID=231916 RepID=A0A409YWQ7_9AGAR|nr:hypothetical protein CVT26_013436 [Gymnopilus dilepis]
MSLHADSTEQESIERPTWEDGKHQSPEDNHSKGPTSANTDTDHSTSGNSDSYSADANIAPTSVDAADALDSKKVDEDKGDEEDDDEDEDEDDEDEDDDFPRFEDAAPRGPVKSSVSGQKPVKPIKR